MTGMFMGMSKSFTATIDGSPDEVMILPPEAESMFGNNSGQPRRNIPAIYEHPDVLEVQPLNGNWAFWSNFPKEGQASKGNGVQVIIVDPVKGAVTLPNDFGDDIVQALQEPYAVVVDRSSLVKLGVQVSDKAKMNGITVWVRAITTGYPSMFNSMVFVSRQTAKLLFHADDGPRVGPLLVKIKDPSRAGQVAAELNVLAKGQYKAWSREELSEVNQRSMLKEGGIVVMIGFAVVVGAFIGVIITWQTLQGALLANIKEFASLRALGVSMGSLRLIVMELSLWVGLAGLTLTAALTGLLRPDEGEVLAVGESLWKKRAGKIDKFRLDRCGFIFQGFNLFPSLDATEQVVQVLKYCGVGKRESRVRATAVLETVGLGQRLHQKPAELSGGEKQRVAIARALAKSPSLIFADEPTSALDSVNGQVVIKLLHQAAQERGAAIVVVTHDPRLEAHADPIIHMESGNTLNDQMISPPPPFGH